jgi:hypothetical protein
MGTDARWQALFNAARRDIVAAAAREFPPVLPADRMLRRLVLHLVDRIESLEAQVRELRDGRDVLERAEGAREK